MTVDYLINDAPAIFLVGDVVVDDNKMECQIGRRAGMIVVGARDVSGTDNRYLGSLGGWGEEPHNWKTLEAAVAAVNRYL